MWIRETADGVEVDLGEAFLSLEAKRKDAIRKIKESRDKVEGMRQPEENIILQIGTKYFNLVAAQKPASFDDILKGEYDKQLEELSKKLTAESESAVQDFKMFAETTLKQGEEEINKLKQKLQNAAVMPEIGYNHARAGLSVVKSAQPGGLIWLFYTVYAPQFLNTRRINSVLAKKMVTPMIILIHTKNDSVLGIETRTLSLDSFRHYHRTGSHTSSPGGDCWGNWKPLKTFKSPDDILSLAKEAANILVTINENSIACDRPRKLPRLSTIRQNLVPQLVEQDDTLILNPVNERAGIATVARNRGGWTT